MCARDAKTYDAHREIPPVWGRWLILWMFSKSDAMTNPLAAWHGRQRYIKHDHPPAHTRSGAQSTPFGDTRFPPIRAGGGFPRGCSHRGKRYAGHATEGKPAALNPWGKWDGADAQGLCEKFIGSTIGGSIADSDRGNYKGGFAQRVTFRRINGFLPYLASDTPGDGTEEESGLSYIARSVGPLG